MAEQPVHPARVRVVEEETVAERVVGPPVAARPHAPTAHDAQVGRGGGVAVLDDRRRHEVQPSAPREPQRPLDVVVPVEEVRPRHDRRRHVATHQHADERHVADLERRLGRRTGVHRPVRHDAHPRERVPARVRRLHMAVVADFERRDGGGARVGGGVGGEEAVEGVGGRAHVVVHHPHPRPRTARGDLGKAPRESAGGAGVGIGANDGHARVGGGAVGEQVSRRAVSRGIVEDEDGVRSPRLGVERIERVGEERGAVVRDDERAHADEHRGGGRNGVRHGGQ